MDFTFFEKIVLNYFEKHPEIVEQLIEKLVARLLAHLG